MNKILVLLIILALALFACGDNSAQENRDLNQDSQQGVSNIIEQDEPEQRPADDLPELDMQGYNFNIFNFDESWFTWRNTRILAEEQIGDIVTDAIYLRQRQIEERFNCLLTINELDSTTESLRRNVSAGDNTYQLYSIYDQDFGVLVPYVLDANLIPYIKVGEKHWNPYPTSLYNFDNKQLALAGNISLGVVSGAGCMIFNKDIFRDFFPGEDLYSYVRDNKWTLDNFFAIALTVGTDINGNGVWDADDLYGLNSSFKGYVGGLMTGAGIGFTGLDDYGVPVYNLHQNAAALGLMTRMMDALNMPGFHYSEAAEVYDTLPADFFANGHALFNTGSAFGVERLRAMEAEIGILPLPKYNENQDRYFSTTYGNSLWVLPKTLDLGAESDNAGIILEAMSFAGYYDIIPQYKEVVLKTKTARDDESADMIDIIFDSVYFTFDMNILFDAVLQSSILPALWRDKTSGNIVSLSERNAPTIDRYIATFFRAVDAVD